MPTTSRLARLFLPTLLPLIGACTEPPTLPEPVGPCAASLWEDVDRAGAVWVAPGGDGDGGEDTPHGSIQAAMDAAAGGLVLLKEGDYAELLSFGPAHDGLRLLGPCADAVRLDLSDSVEGVPGLAVALESGQGVEVGGATLHDSTGDAIRVEAGLLTLRDVEVHDYFGRGIHALGADAALALQDVAARRGEGEDSPAFGGGLRVHDGAQASGAGLVLEDSYGWGLDVRNDGARAELWDLLATGSRSPRVGLSGATCVRVAEGGTVVLHDSVLSQAMGSGAAAVGGTMVFEDVDVVDIQQASDGHSSGAIAVIAASLEMTGGSIEGAFATGIYLADAGASASLTDVTIAEIRGEGQPVNGFGIRVESVVPIITEADRPRLSLSGGRIVNTDTTAISLHRTARTAATIDGTEITGAGALGGDHGSALGVGGGDVTIDRAWFHDNRQHGVEAANEGTTVTLRDSTIERHDSRPDYTAVGVFAYDGAVVTLEDCTIREVASAGVVAWPGGRVILQGGVVSGQTASESTTVGRGLHAELGGLVEATGTELGGNAGPGIVATGGGLVHCTECLLVDNQFAAAYTNGGELRLVRSRLEDTGSHASEGGGYGLYTESRSDPQVWLDDADVAGNLLAGVVLDNTEDPIDGAGIQIIGSRIHGGAADHDTPALATYGDALLACGGLQAWDGERGLRIADSTFADAGRVGLLLNSSSASLQGDVVFEGNAVDAAQQPCADADASLDGVDGALSCDSLPYDFAVECPGLDFVDLVPSEVGR